jgi:hypothetical protein
MGQLANLRFAPGLFTESTNRGADGRWRDGNMVRWNNGMPEVVGGWQAVATTGDTVAGIPRAIKEWSTLDGLDVAAIGTNRRLYLLVNNEYFNITPFRDEGTLTDPFSMTSGSAVVSVAHTAHGLAEGDAVFFTNDTAVGGLTISGEYTVTEVVDADTYTITAASNASSTAGPGGGSVGYGYEINVGLAETGLVFGFGAGTWGEGTWGTPRAESTFVAPLRVWSLDTWGEDLIASPSGGAVYWWDRSEGFGRRAQLVSQAPSKNLRVIVSQENRQLICLGTTDDLGNLDPLFIRWSDTEDFTDFEILEENSAGSQRIDGGSEIVTAIRTRSGILIWTDQTLHLMQPTGDSLVYDFRQLGSGVSLTGPNAALDAGGVVYAFAVDNFYVFDGTLRVLPCDVWTRVFSSFNLSQRRMVYASLNTKFSEIWWFYPPDSSNSNTRLVVYNYRDGLWWYGNLQRSAFSGFGPLFEKPFGFDDDGDLYTHEDPDGSTDLESYIVSDDIEIGEGQAAMHVSTLIPDFKELIGTATVTLTGKLYPAASTKTKGPHSVTSSTRKISTRMKARQVSLRVAMGAGSGRFRMGEWRAEIEQDGER